MPNLLPSRLCSLLSLQLEKSRKSINVADGSTSSTFGTLKGISVSFDGQAALLDILVVDEMPVDTIIGTPTLEQLKASIDMGHN